MHKTYRVRVTVAAEIGRPAQAFTIQVRSVSLRMVERQAWQCVKDRNWAKEPLDSSIEVVSVEEVQP